VLGRDEAIARFANRLAPDCVSRFPEGHDATCKADLPFVYPDSACLHAGKSKAGDVQRGASRGVRDGADGPPRRA